MKGTNLTEGTVHLVSQKRGKLYPRCESQAKTILHELPDDVPLTCRLCKKLEAEENAPSVTRPARRARVAVPERRVQPLAANQHRCMSCHTVRTEPDISFIASVGGWLCNMTRVPCR